MDVVILILMIDSLYSETIVFFLDEHGTLFSLKFKDSFYFSRGISISQVLNCILCNEGLVCCYWPDLFICIILVCAFSLTQYLNLYITTPTPQPLNLKFPFSNSILPSLYSEHSWYNINRGGNDLHILMTTLFWSVLFCLECHLSPLNSIWESLPSPL